jgi:hypothetical protein
MFCAALAGGNDQNHHPAHAFGKNLGPARKVGPKPDITAENCWIGKK